MMLIMRTTLTLDEEIAAKLKDTAHRSGKSFKRVVNETLSAGLAAAAAPRRSRRYRLEPAALGGVRAGIDLDKALRLADALEDEAIRQKLEARK